MSVMYGAQCFRVNGIGALSLAAVRLMQLDTRRSGLVPEHGHDRNSNGILSRFPGLSVDASLLSKHRWRSCFMWLLPDTPALLALASNTGRRLRRAIRQQYHARPDWPVEANEH